MRGIPSPVLSASLSYFETYTSLNLPANLIQGKGIILGHMGSKELINRVIILMTGTNNDCYYYRCKRLRKKYDWKK